MPKLGEVAQRNVHALQRARLSHRLLSVQADDSRTAVS